MGKGCLHLIATAAAISMVASALGRHNVDEMTEEEVGRNSFSLIIIICFNRLIARYEDTFALSHQLPIVVRLEVRRLPQPLHDGRDQNGLLSHEARQGASTLLFIFHSNGLSEAKMKQLFTQPVIQAYQTIPDSGRRKPQRWSRPRRETASSGTKRIKASNRGRSKVTIYVLMLVLTCSM